RAGYTTFDRQDCRLTQDGAGAELRASLGLYRRNRFPSEFLFLNGLEHELLYPHEDSPGSTFRNVRDSQSLCNLYILAGLPTATQHPLLTIDQGLCSGDFKAAVFDLSGVPARSSCSGGLPPVAGLQAGVFTCEQNTR